MARKNTIVGFAFEGVGISTSSTAGCCFYAAHHAAPSSGTDYQWINALVGPPPSVETMVNPYTGDWSISAFSPELMRSDRLAELFFYEQVVADGELDSAVTSSATTIPFDVSGHAGEVAWVGDEAILLGAYSAGTGYTGCTRAFWGTSATAHDAGVGVWLALPYWQTRLVKLIEHDLDTGAERVRWRGMVRDIYSSADGARVIVECDELLGALASAEVNRDSEDLNPQCERFGAGVAISGHTLRVSGATSPLGGYFQIGELAIYGSRRNAGDIYCAGGGGAGSIGLYGSEATEAFSRETPVYEICVMESFSSLVRDRHPLAIALALLVSGGDGSSSYDVLGESWGLAAEWVDEAQWTAEISATPSLQIDQLVLGWDGAPVNVLRVVQEKLLRPFGYFLTLTVDGLIGLGRLRLLDVADWQAAASNGATIYPDGPLQWQSSLQSAAKQVVAEVGALPWSDGRRVVIRQAAQSRRRALLSEVREHALDMSVIRPERLQVTGREDSDLANALVNLLQLGLDTAPRLRVRVPDYTMDGDLSDLDLGAVVKLDSLEVENAWLVGNDGQVTATTDSVQFAGLLVGRRWDVSDHTYELTLLMVSYRAGAYSRLRAPAQLVESYDAGPPATITVKNALGEDADGAEVFTEGDEVTIWQRDGTQANAEVLVVDTVSGTTIELTSAPTRTPVEDDIIRLARSKDFSNDALYSVTIRPFTYLADGGDFEDAEGASDSDIYGSRVYGGT